MAEPSKENLSLLHAKAEGLTEYAPGRAQLHRDVKAAEASENWDVFQCLGQVMKTKAESALMLRELYTKAIEIRKNTEPLPPKPLGFSHRWHPQDPVWPNDATMRDAISKMPSYGQGFEELSRLAYKAVFEREWEKEFMGLDGRPVILNDDSQGWAMRDAVIARCKKYMEDATTLSPLDVTQQCCVFDGRNIFYAEKVSESPFVGELLNVSITGRSGVRSTHRNEIWVCFPRYSI